MAMKKRHAKRLRQIGGWLLALVILVFVAEWVSRGMQDKLLDSKSNPLVAFDPATGYTLKPHAVADLQNPVGDRVVVDINSLGLRGREVASKRSREFRIVGLGDTFTAALPVAVGDTYLKQLEKTIESASSSSTVVHAINAGIPGYNLEQESCLLAKLGEALDPDLVLVGLYVADDIREYGQEIGLPVPGKGFLQKKSYLYHGLRRAYHRIRGGGPGGADPDAPKMAAWKSTFERYGESPDDEQITRFVQLARRETPVYRSDGISDAEWSGTEMMLGEIRDRADKLGARTVIALVPTKRQILENEWAKTVELLNLSPGEYDLDRPQRELVPILSRVGIPTIDLLPVFRSALSPDSLYWTGYPHWTPVAHRLAAETIYEFLAHEDLLRP